MLSMATGTHAQRTATIRRNLPGGRKKIGKKSRMHTFGTATECVRV